MVRRVVPPIHGNVYRGCCEKVQLRLGALAPVVGLFLSVHGVEKMSTLRLLRGLTDLRVPTTLLLRGFFLRGGGGWCVGGPVASMAPSNLWAPALTSFLPTLLSIGATKGIAFRMIPPSTLPRPAP